MCGFRAMVPGGRGLGLLTLVLESGGLGSRSLGLKIRVEGFRA